MDDPSEFEWYEFRENDPLMMSPRRYKKLKVYADENIPSFIVEEVRKIGIPAKTAVEDSMTSHSDQDIYQRAKHIGRVLLTMDRDFWNDRLHPLQKGRGVIYVDVSPNQPKEATYAFMIFYYMFAKYWPLDWWEDMKAQVTKSGFIIRIHTWKGTVKEYEFCFTNDGRLFERRLK